MERQATHDSTYDEDLPSITVTASARKSSLMFAKRPRESDETFDETNADVQSPHTRGTATERAGKGKGDRKSQSTARSSQQSQSSQLVTPSIVGASQTRSRTPGTEGLATAGPMHVGTPSLLYDGASPKTVARAPKVFEEPVRARNSSSRASSPRFASPRATTFANAGNGTAVLNDAFSPVNVGTFTGTLVPSATTTPVSEVTKLKSKGQDTHAAASMLLGAHDGGSSPMLTLGGEIPATPSSGELTQQVMAVEDIATPQTILTQRTQEAMISQALRGTSNDFRTDALTSSQLLISQPADVDATPLADQLARVQQPMTVGRAAEGTGEYAPPSPNVDLFANFGFTPLQSQAEVPQLRRRNANASRAGANRAASSVNSAIASDNSGVPATAGSGSLHPTQLGDSPQATMPSGNDRYRRGDLRPSPQQIHAVIDIHHGQPHLASKADPAVALELSPMTNTQKDRRAADSWCMMAKNFFDFIDEKPLKTVSAAKLVPSNANPGKGAARKA